MFRLECSNYLIKYCNVVSSFENTNFAILKIINIFSGFLYLQCYIRIWKMVSDIVSIKYYFWFNDVIQWLRLTGRKEWFRIFVNFNSTIVNFKLKMRDLILSRSPVRINAIKCTLIQTVKQTSTRNDSLKLVVELADQMVLKLDDYLMSAWRKFNFKIKKLIRYKVNFFYRSNKTVSEVILEEKCHSCHKSIIDTESTYNTIKYENITELRECQLASKESRKCIFEFSKSIINQIKFLFNLEELGKLSSTLDTISPLVKYLGIQNKKSLILKAHEK